MSARIKRFFRVTVPCLCLLASSFAQGQFEASDLPAVNSTVSVASCSGPASPYFSIETKRAALHVAMLRRDIAQMAILLQETPGLVNAQDEYGFTILHYVVNRRNSADMVQLLLKYQPSFTPNQFGSTPFDEAFHFGDKTIIKLLINYSNKNNFRPSIEIQKIYKLLFTSIKKYGNIRAVLERLAMFPIELDFNVRNKEGSTLLSMAVQHNQIDNVRALLDYGAHSSVGATDRDGNTAFFWALNNENTEIQRLLLPYLSSNNPLTSDGSTFYHYAAILDPQILERALLVAAYGPFDEAIDIGSLLVGATMERAESPNTPNGLPPVSSSPAEPTAPSNRSSTEREEDNLPSIASSVEVEEPVDSLSSDPSLSSSEDSLEDVFVDNEERSNRFHRYNIRPVSNVSHVFSGDREGNHRYYSMMRLSGGHSR